MGFINGRERKLGGRRRMGFFNGRRGEREGEARKWILRDKFSLSFTTVDLI